MSDGRPVRGVRALFPTPLLIDELDQAEELNAVLAERIVSMRKQSEGVDLSNRGGWQSNHDFARWSGQEGQTVIRRACELASSHVQRADGSLVRWAVDAWANVSGPGAFNMPHIHGGTFWAAVYYVRTGGGSGGQLVLHDPRMPGLRMHAPGLRFIRMGPELKMEIAPKDGLLVLFPGWLSHSVEPWDGPAERISLAMNIRAV